MSRSLHYVFFFLSLLTWGIRSLHHPIVVSPYSRHLTPYPPSCQSRSSSPPYPKQSSAKLHAIVDEAVISLSSRSTSLQTDIFCNRELQGEDIDAVGFDMDFTLAQYNEEFNSLAFEGSKRRLHEVLGYPKEVLDFQFEPSKFQRGLLIDREKGNIIKMNRHKYVRKVYHGTKEVSREERKAMYHSSSFQTLQFDEERFVNIDTLFLLVDAMLFSHLVDWRNARKTSEDEVVDYAKLYKDVRKCVDLCHRDGAIKDEVMKNPAKYIIYDSKIVPMIKRYIKAGKKTFLLTNSYWDYSNVVMKYLVHGAGDNKDIKNWHDLFNLVVVGASKPSFLTNEYLTLYRLNPDGKLFNIEDPDTLSTTLAIPSPEEPPAHLFQGGHWKDLQKLLGISIGERIMYVGDHMYSDILRSKRSLGWRTCLVIPELEKEIAVASEHFDQSRTIREFRQLQYDLDEYIEILRQRARLGVEEVEVPLKEATDKAAEIKAKIRRLDELYDLFFNEAWGQLFKAGNQESWFANQVSNFACIYTSKVSNLGKASPNRPYRPTQDYMPHDQVLFDEEQFNV